MIFSSIQNRKSLPFSLFLINQFFAIMTISFIININIILAEIETQARGLYMIGNYSPSSFLFSVLISTDQCNRFSFLFHCTSEQGILL